MRSPFLLPLSIATAFAAIGACGGDVTVDGDSTTSTGGAGNSTGGGGLASGQCRSMSDCGDDLLECVPPGTSPGCGVCDPEPPCTDDAECAAMGEAFICTVVPCGCMPMECAQGCTSDAGCAMGETCTSSHHCVPTECTAGTDCPVDFDCNGDATCTRRACTTDAVCNGGFCVNGECYGALGTCMSIPV